jgi:nitrate reductase NapAB chaperone NapD
MEEMEMIRLIDSVFSIRLVYFSQSGTATHQIVIQLDSGKNWYSDRF